MGYDSNGQWHDEPEPDLNDPKNAPPNSTWDPAKGGWVTKKPGSEDYDPTWGGYTTGDPRGTSQGDKWLKTVYEAQGWDLPSVDGPTPTGPSPGGDDQPRPPSGSLPTPERYPFTRPDRPDRYSSTYEAGHTYTKAPEYVPGAYQQGTYAEVGTGPFTGVGEADRNRIMQSILQNPETMGQTQQDQLFEQQKELLNAQRAQQLAGLSQGLAARGLSGAGGAALAGALEAGQDFSGQLLGAQRDIATRAVTQNRADKLAALQMQQAMASGDYERMMGLYQANQRERQFGAELARQERQFGADFGRQERQFGAKMGQEERQFEAGFGQKERENVENYLRQAADLTQQGVLGFNAAQLGMEQAQHREMMGYYEFLENQRNARNLLNYNYARLAAGGY